MDMSDSNKKMQQSSIASKSQKKQVSRHCVQLWIKSIPCGYSYYETVQFWNILWF